MKIKLVTDASALMPLEMMEKENIGYYESLLLMDDKEFRELTELDYEKFVNSLHELDPYPTTSQVKPEDALSVFKQAVEDGYDEVLYLGLTPKVSSQMNVVRLAAKTMKRAIKIHLYPTETTTGSQGAMTYNAMKLLQKGKSAEEIMEYLDGIKEKIYTIGVNEDIKTLFRTGRVKRGSAKGILVTLLRMKPIAHITLKDGYIGYGAGTSYKSVLKKMIAAIESKTEPDKEYNLFMADALNKEFAEVYANEIKKVRKIKEVHYWNMSPVMALTAGKRAVTATIAPVVED